MSALPAIPDVPTEARVDDEGEADFVAQHIEELRTFDAWWSSTKRRLAQRIRDLGPIPTVHGRLALESSGYEYPAEIGVEFPGLVKSHTVTFEVRTREEAERALSLVTEEIPTAVVKSHDVEVDGRAAAALINQPGAAGARVRELRKPKGAKLKVA